MTTGRAAVIVRNFLLAFGWCLFVFIILFSLSFPASGPTPLFIPFCIGSLVVMLLLTRKVSKLNATSKAQPMTETRGMVAAQDTAPNDIQNDPPARLNSKTRDLNTLILLSPLALFILLCIIFYGFRSSRVVTAVVPIDVEIGGFPFVILFFLELLAGVIVFARKNFND